MKDFAKELRTLYSNLPKDKQQDLKESFHNIDDLDYSVLEVLLYQNLGAIVVCSQTIEKSLKTLNDIVDVLPSLEREISEYAGDPVEIVKESLFNRVPVSNKYSKFGQQICESKKKFLRDSNADDLNIIKDLRNYYIHNFILDDIYLFHEVDQVKLVLKDTLLLLASMSFYALVIIEDFHSYFESDYPYYIKYSKESMKEIFHYFTTVSELFKEYEANGKKTINKEVWDGKSLVIGLIENDD